MSEVSDLQKEIDDMIGAIAPETSTADEKALFGEEAPKEPEKEPSPEPAEEPKGEPVEEPAGETKGDVIEEEPAPSTKPEPPAEPAEDPRVLAMQDTINQLSQRLLQLGQQPEVQRPPTEVAPQPPPQPPQIDLDMGKFQIFPEGVEFEDIVNDKSTFERFMRDVLSRYEVSRVRRDTLVAPQLVSRQVQYFMNLNEAVRTFYDANKDLANVKPLVGAFTNKIVAEHPDWSLPQVMEEAAKSTRQAIGLGVSQAKAQGQAKPSQPVKPSFVAPSTTRKVQPKSTELQKQIDDLIDGF